MKTSIIIFLAISLFISGCIDFIDVFRVDEEIEAAVKAEDPEK